MDCISNMFEYIISYLKQFFIASQFAIGASFGQQELPLRILHASCAFFYEVGKRQQFYFLRKTFDEI